ncbi:MAG: hypothetical protein ACREQN_03595 [Candidatus Binataceae bacterium]
MLGSSSRHGSDVLSTDKDLQKFLGWVQWLSSIALLALIACGISAAWQQPAGIWTWHQAVESGVRVFGLGLLFSLAAAAFGVVLGFLFGIPRTIENTGGVRAQSIGRGRQNRPATDAPAAPPTNPPAPTTSPPATVETAEASGITPVGESRVNTNLEQISDWLTKIIVGISLAEFSTIMEFLRALVVSANSNGFDWNEGGKLFGLSIIMLFVPFGFMVGYVITRTYLTRMFVHSEEENLQ